MGSDGSRPELAGVCQNRVLLGDIAVGLILIDGPGGRDLNAQAEKVVVEQLNRALTFLAQAEPRAELRFQQIHQRCSLSTRDLAPQMTPDESTAPESVWLRPALQRMGYQSQLDCLRSVLRKKNCRQGFLVLVSKFPLPHFAYCVGASIFLSYYGGGFGKRNLHALLVHEICHVFGAADEAGPCRCDRLFGHLGIENGNCMQCNENPQPCIMAGNDLALCAWTRRQIGWDKTLMGQR